MSIEVRNISKSFGRFRVLKGLSLEIESGKLVALLGPSGCGKTTLLRIVAGLETPDEGSILFHGEDATNRTARDRKVGFVFQHYALFQHMTVFDNVAFGLKVRPRKVRPSKAVIRDRVMELLRLVHMEELADRYPSQLSGGQRQRIALARALAVQPQVLLLDEPFGALDAKVRKELRRWLRRLHDEIHTTSVFVTHDQEEALEVADKVVVINEGRIEQIGTPEEVYKRPASAFVYNFLGSVNMFIGRMQDGEAYIGENRVDLPDMVQVREDSAVICFRPHRLDLFRERVEGCLFSATVLHINPAGPLVKIELVSESGDPVHVEVSQERHQELQLQSKDLVFVSRKA